MGRDKERISVTLNKTQKERLDELWGEDTEFETRSAVVRHIIDEYDTDSEQEERVEDDRSREQSASHSVIFDAGRIVPDNAGTLRQLKWRLLGMPATEYAAALNDARASMNEGESGAVPIDIDAKYPTVEESEE